MSPTYEEIAKSLRIPRGATARPRKGVRAYGPPTEKAVKCPHCQGEFPVLVFINQVTFTLAWPDRPQVDKGGIVVG